MQSGVASYPPSEVITGIDWAPADTIIRKAPGGDNWPMTWADDGHQYTAYGDGYGFEPLIHEKLGLGFARVEGGPADFQGFNIRSATLENRGQGPAGKKASGILMVDGVLYLLVRNAGNSQVAWSEDHGKTWTFSPWKFTTSFGAPSFLNFGKNYAGARDEYVYLYSHDNDSAYERADQMVMARVPKNRIPDRGAYEFFVRIDAAGQPLWSHDIDHRGAVFTHPGECYRQGITYNAGLKRYLWCHIDPDTAHPHGMRFEGGFRIYDAAQPWGPWTTVFATEHWDVGPGETSSFPAKWMSEDGKTVHLVFSGDDHFSVRKATLRTSPEPCDNRGLVGPATGLAAEPQRTEADGSSGTTVWPMPQWQHVLPDEVGMDEAKLRLARDYAMSGGGAGYITRHGRLAMAWGDPRQRYDLKSTTKSFGSIALGLAIGDGKLHLEDKAKKHHPGLGIPPESNAATGWLDEITIFHLASQTAGFEKPGGYTKLLFRPGTRWDYSDSGPNWLAECITLAYGRDLEDWMFERVFTPLGIQSADLTWRKNAYRPAAIEGIARREFGAGIHANVDAMARIGYLMLREGRWNGREILSRDYARLAPRTPPGHEKLPPFQPEHQHGQAAAHYGLLWWNNADGMLMGAPVDAYWSWGLYDSLIVVVPSLDVVVARAGKSWKRNEGADHYEVLRPFLLPIVEAVHPARPQETPAR